jgi:hypothetical protein
MFKRLKSPSYWHASILQDIFLFWGTTDMFAKAVYSEQCLIEWFDIDVSLCSGMRVQALQTA